MNAMILIRELVVKHFKILGFANVKCYLITTVVAGLLLCQLPARTVSQYPHNNLAGGDVSRKHPNLKKR